VWCHSFIYGIAYLQLARNEPLQAEKQAIAAFMTHRESINKKTGKLSQEVIYGITSVTTDQANPEQILGDNRKQWSVKSCHYMIDWNYDEDRGQIRSGHGPENITRLRRFAIGLLKSKKSFQKR